MKNIAIAALIGALAGVVFFVIGWLFCSFIAFEWFGVDWVVLRTFVCAGAVIAFYQCRESD